jgi:hypothetical protein
MIILGGSATVGGAGGSLVIWENKVGVSEDPTTHNLIRTVTGTGWGTSGASSIQSITSTGGSFTCKTSESNLAKMIGFGNANVNANYTDIEFGLLLGNGVLDFYESGVQRPLSTPPYTTADTFKGHVTAGGVVEFFKNDVLVWASGTIATFPLYIDTAFDAFNATLTDVTIGSVETPTPPAGSVTWSALVNAAKRRDNGLVHLGSGSWDGGGFSTQSIGTNGGEINFKSPKSVFFAASMLGLSATNPNASYTSIQFAFHFDKDGNVRVYESGSNRGLFGTYAIGDDFKITVTSAGLVKYYKGATLLYTSTVTATLPLYVDCSFEAYGALIENVVLTSL